jgi:hypothetical protein
MSQVTVAEPDETLDPAPRLELSRAQMNVVFVTILLGLLLSALDQTIVSTALPTIVGDLGGAGGVVWLHLPTLARWAHNLRPMRPVLLRVYPACSASTRANHDDVTSSWSGQR